MSETFLAFSAEATGFSVFELQGTGMAAAYEDKVKSVVGSVLGQLLGTYRELTPASGAARETQLRREIFGNDKLGPIARNIIKLWYVGVWYQLPRAWASSYGARANDVTATVSASAYPVALLWRATGANPPGARAPGYASWAEAPHVPGLEATALKAGRTGQVKLPVNPPSTTDRH